MAFAYNGGAGAGAGAGGDAYYDTPGYAQPQAPGPEYGGPEFGGGFDPAAMQAPQMQAPQMQAPQMQASQMQAPQMQAYSQMAAADANNYGPAQQMLQMTGTGPGQGQSQGQMGTGQGFRQRLQPGNHIFGQGHGGLVAHHLFQCIDQAFTGIVGGRNTEAHALDRTRKVLERSMQSTRDPRIQALYNQIIQYQQDAQRDPQYNQASNAGILTARLNNWKQGNVNRASHAASTMAARNHSRDAKIAATKDYRDRSKEHWNAQLDDLSLGLWGGVRNHIPGFRTPMQIGNPYNPQRYPGAEPGAGPGNINYEDPNGYAQIQAQQTAPFQQQYQYQQV